MHTLTRLQSLVKTHTRKGACSFYRDLYKLPEAEPSLEIKTQKEWERSPIPHQRGYSKSADRKENIRAVFGHHVYPFNVRHFW